MNRILDITALIIILAILAPLFAYLFPLIKKKQKQEKETGDDSENESSSAAEEKFSEILNAIESASKQMILVFDKNQKLKFFGKKAVKFFLPHESEENHKEKHLLDIVPHNKAQEFLELVDALEEKGEVRSRLSWADGFLNVAMAHFHGGFVVYANYEK